MTLAVKEVKQQVLRIVARSGEWETSLDTESVCVCVCVCVCVSSVRGGWDR